MKLMMKTDKVSVKNSNGRSIKMTKGEASMRVAGILCSVYAYNQLTTPANADYVIQ
jgi:hypothetical protein